MAKEQSVVVELRSQLEDMERRILHLLADAAIIRDRLLANGADSDRETYLQDGESLADARIRLQCIADSLPNPAIVQNDIGVLCYQMGEVQNAVRHFQKASAIDQTYLSPKRNLADVYVQLSEWETAIRIHEEILEQNPNDGESLLGLATLRARTGQNESAEYYARRALQLEPTNPAATSFLAELSGASERSVQSENVQCQVGSTTRLSEKEYKAQIDAEIRTYKENVNVHDLPQINHLVNHEMISPMLKELTGVEDSRDWWANELRELCGRLPRKVRAISIGCGNGDVEIDLVRRAQNPPNLELIGIDINPYMVERGNAMARQCGLSNVRFTVGDFNALRLNGGFDIVIANHTLHHVIELEKLFAEIAAHATDEMIFLVNDMIGRNGHVMWKNTEAVMNAVWESLDEKYKLNGYTRSYDSAPQNQDFSNEGFEGIRAQDILPLLIETFDVDVFVPFYAFINRLVERAYGHNYRMDSPDDIATARRFVELDLKLLAEKKLSPVQAFMRLRKKGRGGALQYRLQTPVEALASREYPIAESDFFPECFGEGDSVSTSERAKLFTDIFG